jgi:hypothetical protein
VLGSSKVATGMKYALGCSLYVKENGELQIEQNDRCTFSEDL